MALLDRVKAAAAWLKYKTVYTAINPTEEFVASGSIEFAKQSVYDVLAEITSSTPMSSSITVIEAGSIVRADHPELVRLADGLYNSALRVGSTIIHNDVESGSGIFVSGSYYQMTASNFHGNTRIENFEMVRDSIEYTLREKISEKKGVTLAAAEASASYTGSIDAIKALP